MSVWDGIIRGCNYDWLFVAKFPQRVDSFPIQTDIINSKSYCRVIMETCIGNKK